MPSSITLFLTTGRSGTQSLYQLIAEQYGDAAVVRREAIKFYYNCRALLRHPRPSEIVDINAVLAKHIETIAAI